MLYVGYILSTTYVVVTAIGNEQELKCSQTTKETVSIVDDIALKQTEMRNTVVQIQTHQGSGSGTIIDRIDTDEEGEYEYRVLTNAHVTHSRLTKHILKVDSMTGKIHTGTIDTGCWVITFDYEKRNKTGYMAKVISESAIKDLAMISFVSKEELDISNIPTKKMLKQVRVFDEVFAIGCQLGRNPSPTVGIISQILDRGRRTKEWLIYGTTAQITPGSSGGGLFKKYDNNYYLVGIPFRAMTEKNGQMFPHLAYAVSMTSAFGFIDQNAVTNP